MSAYVVLARKWRPAQFKDIVGQGPVVRTLMNAIQAQRIHQAYLFTGSRGIGKTSIARIFAKAVRCPNVSVGEAGLQSCDNCPSCREIAAGNSVDVIEIDGASNNGVDAIREIRENAKYLPSSGTRKIYIIDEVHMLTTAAFNALLKTLEEPPSHVIFIFATTEPHKIPATILSRCQRFDFKRVTASQIQGRITEVCTAEGLKAEPAALALIARAAEGSMRDALSILDQVIAFSGQKISLEGTRESIGVIGSQATLGILKGILGRAPLDALSLANAAYEQGHDLKVLTRSLIEFLYGAILAKVGAQPPAVLETSADEWKEIQALAELRPLEELEIIFQVLHHGIDSVSRSSQPKIVLDILLIKCATADVLISADAVQQTAAPTGSSGLKTATTPSVSTATKPAKTQAEQASTAPPAAATPRTWEGFVESIRKNKPMLATALEYSVAAELPDLTQVQAPVFKIHFSADDSYKRDQLQARAYRDDLDHLAKDYFGRPIVVQVVISENAGESMAAKRDRERKIKENHAREAVFSNPIIREAQALFGGELGPIEITEGNAP